MTSKYDLSYIDLNDLNPDIIEPINKIVKLLEEAFSNPNNKPIKFFSLEELYEGFSDREALIEYFEIQNNVFNINQKLLQDKISPSKRNEILNRVIPIPEKLIFIPFTDENYATLYKDKLIIYSLAHYEMFELVSNPILLDPLETHMKFWLISSFSNKNKENYGTLEYEHLDPERSRLNSRAIFEGQKNWKYKYENRTYTWKYIKENFYSVTYTDGNNLFTAISKVINGCYLDLLEHTPLSVLKKYKWWIEQFKLEHLEAPISHYNKMCLEELNTYISKIDFRPKKLKKYLDPVEFVKNNYKKLSLDMINLLGQIEKNNLYYTTPENIPEITNSNYFGISI